MDELMIANLEIPILSAPISPIHSDTDDSDSNILFICSECDMKFYSRFEFNSHKSSHTQKLNLSNYPLPSFDNIKNPIKIKEEFDSDEQVNMYTYDSHVPYAIKEEIVYDTKHTNHNQPSFEDRHCINISNNNLMINTKQTPAYDCSVEPLITDSEVKLELPDVTEVGVYYDRSGRLDFFSLDDNSSASDNMQLCFRKDKFLKECTDPFMNDHCNPDKRPSLELKQMPILDTFDKSDVNKFQEVSPTIYPFSDESFDMDYESSDFPSEWENDNVNETLYQSVNGKHYKSQMNHNDQSNFMKIKCSFKLAKIKTVEDIDLFGCSDCDIKYQDIQDIQEHIVSYKPHIHMIRKNVEVRPFPCSNCDSKGFHLYQILSRRMKQKEDIIYVCLDTNIISVNNNGIWKYFPKGSDIKCDVLCPSVLNTTPL